MNSEQVAQGFHPSSAENLQGQALWATRPSTRLSSQRNFPPPLISSQTMPFQFMTIISHSCVMQLSLAVCKYPSNKHP